MSEQMPQTIEASLTDANLDALDLADRDCPICLMPLEESTSGTAEGSNEEATDISTDERTIGWSTGPPRGPSDTNIGHNPARVRCGHVYGKHCIIYWLQLHTSYPQCRRQVYTRNASETLREADVRFWRDSHRTPALEAIRELLTDSELTMNVAIVQRGLGLILNNTSDDENPDGDWWYMTWRLDYCLRDVALAGWDSYLQFLQDCIADLEAHLMEWAASEDRDRWLRSEHTVGYIEVLRDEVAASREDMLWEAFPALFE